MVSTDSFYLKANHHRLFFSSSFCSEDCWFIVQIYLALAVGVCTVSVLIYHRPAPSQPLVCFCAGETRPMIHCCVPELTNRDASAEQREVQAHLLMTVLEVLPQRP